MIPIEEFVERVERLFNLFPNYIHIMRTDYAEYNTEKLIEACREKGIICKYNDYGEYTEEYLRDLAWSSGMLWDTDIKRFVFTLEKSQEKGTGIVEYFERVCRKLSDEVFYAHPGSSIGVCIYGVHDIYIDVSVDNPLLPKLQADILNAIFGKSWVNHYKFEMSNVGLLLLPKLEKLL